MALDTLVLEALEAKQMVRKMTSGERILELAQPKRMLKPVGGALVHAKETVALLQQSCFSEEPLGPMGEIRMRPLTKTGIEARSLKEQVVPRKGFEIAG